MKKNRIRLTEAQLKRVIKESVRKVLREGDENSNDVYVAINIQHRSAEDSYENGENPNNEAYWSEYGDVNIKGSTIQELIQKAAEHYDYKPEEIGVFGDQIRMECLADEDNIRFSEKQYGRWKQGQIKGYNHEVSFNVVKQTPLSHDELVANGYEDWGDY